MWQQSLNQGFFKINTVCSACGGRGAAHPPCTACHGDGTVRERRSVVVVVPPGVDSHHQLKVSGQGDAGRRGGVNGDIRVRLHIAPHSTFTREGNDVHVTVPVPLTTAVLGGSVTVPTLTGEAVLKVDPGTQPGERRVMRAKGIKDVARSSSVGSQYVTFNVQIPTSLTAQQRSAMEAFSNAATQSTSTEKGSNGGFKTGAASSRTASSSSSSSSSSSGIFSSLFGSKDRSKGEDGSVNERKSEQKQHSKS